MSRSEDRARFLDDALTIVSATIDTMDSTILHVKFSANGVNGGGPGMDATIAITTGSVAGELVDNSAPDTYEISANAGGVLVPGPMQITAIDDITFPGKTVILPISATQAL